MVVKCVKNIWETMRKYGKGITNNLCGKLEKHKGKWVNAWGKCMISVFEMHEHRREM